MCDLDLPNVLFYPLVGGTRLAHETDKTQSHEKSQFGGENPAVRVHAVLGGVFTVTKFQIQGLCLVH
jgi:hypothetical protein